MSITAGGTTGNGNGSSTPIVNDLTTGGTTSALSAQQGVVLAGQVAAAVGTSYLGQTATNCYTLSSNNGTGGPAQAMWETAHYARDTIVNPIITLPNYWRAANGSDTGSGSDAVTTLAIRVGATITRGTFSSSNTATITNGLDLQSDPVPVTIAKGTLFFTRGKITFTAGVGSLPFLSRTNAVPGCVVTFGSSVTDQTMSGTVVATAPGVQYGPTQILSQTRLPSVLIIGDSRPFAYTDTADSNLDLGEIGRAVGRYHGYSICATPGDGLNSIQTRASRTFLSSRLANYTHFIIYAGGNDLNGGTSVASVKGFFSAVVAALPASGVIFACTLPPFNTGTFTGAGGAGQTKGSADANFVALNDYFRNDITKGCGVIDVADAVTTGRNTDFWLPSFTTDGIHVVQLGALAAARSGVVPVPFTR